MHLLLLKIEISCLRTFYFNRMNWLFLHIPREVSRGVVVIQIITRWSNHISVTWIDLLFWVEHLSYICIVTYISSEAMQAIMSRWDPAYVNFLFIFYLTLNSFSNLNLIILNCFVSSPKPAMKSCVLSSKCPCRHTVCSLSFSLYRLSLELSTLCTNDSVWGGVGICNKHISTSHKYMKWDKYKHPPNMYYYLWLLSLCV